MAQQIVLKTGTGNPEGLIVKAEPAVDLRAGTLYIGGDSFTGQSPLVFSNDSLLVKDASLGTSFVWTDGALDVSVAAGATSLAALTDASISESDISTGDLLAYNGEKWTNTGIQTGELIDVIDGSLLDIAIGSLIDISTLIDLSVISTLMGSKVDISIGNTSISHDGADINIQYLDVPLDNKSGILIGWPYIYICCGPTGVPAVLEIQPENILIKGIAKYGEGYPDSFDESTIIDKGFGDSAYLQKTVSDGLKIIDGSIVFGDYANGNYLEIYSDGTVRLHGAATGYDDLFVPLVQSKQGSTDLPHFDYDEVAYMFPQNDADEILYFQVQIPHRWKEGSRLYPHVHYRQASASTIPVYKLDYKIASIGGSFNTAWQTYTMDTSTVAWVDSSTHQLNRGDGGIDASTYTKSAIMLCKLYRDDDVVSGDVPTYQFDIHYEVDSFGSETEFTKI